MGLFTVANSFGACQLNFWIVCAYLDDYVLRISKRIKRLFLTWITLRSVSKRKIWARLTHVLQSSLEYSNEILYEINLS